MYLWCIVWNAIDYGLSVDERYEIGHAPHIRTRLDFTSRLTSDGCPAHNPIPTANTYHLFSSLSMSRIPLPYGGLHNSLPHSPQPAHADNMSTSSPASDTRRKQSKRDEVSLVCIRLEWVVDGGMEWVRRAHEHECRRAWCGAWSAPSSCVLVHYTWCMGGNSAGCVRVCFFCLKRRKTTNNPSSLALFFIALIVPSSSSFFFLHHFFHTYTIHHRYTISSRRPLLSDHIILLIGDLPRPCLSPWSSAPLPSLTSLPSINRCFPFIIPSASLSASL